MVKSQRGAGIAPVRWGTTGTLNSGRRRCHACPTVLDDHAAAAPRSSRDPARATAVRRPHGQPTRSVKTFVLDTSVLLSDPGALARFGEHEVVLPLVVIGELEGKRHHPELGWFARQTLRTLDELRIRHGRLDAPVPVGDDGGTPARRAEPLRPGVAAGRLPGRDATTPGSWRSR